MSKFTIHYFVVDQVYYSDGFYHITSGTTGFALNKIKLNGTEVRIGDKIVLYLVDVTRIIGADINGKRCYLHL